VNGIGRRVFIRSVIICMKLCYVYVSFGVLC
jgi:hypothetical protein